MTPPRVPAELLDGHLRTLLQGRAEQFGLRLAESYLVAVARGLGDASPDRIERDLTARFGLKRDVVKAADLLVFPVLLRDRSAMEDLVTSVLSPLLGSRGGHEPLLETLEAVFAAQGNQTAAARRLGVSTRAVTYRLQRVHRLTGFSPDDPTQRFTLETAVLGARLLDWPWDEPRRSMPFDGGAEMGKLTRRER